MEATYESDTDRVVVRNDARQQLYDASGYGEPLDGDKVSLTPVEAAYLLREEKLGCVDGDGYSCFVRRVVEEENEPVLRAYTDLRERGYYLSHDEELYLYARGDHPASSSPETRVKVVDESARVCVEELPSLLAVADHDDDVTYFSVESEEIEGSYPDATDVSADEVATRGRGVAVVSGGDALRDARYGAQEGDGDEDVLLLSPVEAAYLADVDVLDASFDRDTRTGSARLAVYADLRDSGVCPRTGFKFGADFRVYETPHDDHAGLLVSAVDRDVRLPVVEISRAVRLAHGVKKRMVFALVDGDEDAGVEYVEVKRERP